MTGARIGALIVAAGLLGAGLAGVVGQALAAWPEVEMSAPEEHDFTLIRHFRYTERVYDPPVTVEVLETRPEVYGGPEAVLQAQVSAAKAGDYDWWTDTWDVPSLAKMTAAGMSRAAQLERWAEAWDGTNAVMTRWVLFRDYVILGYRLVGKGGSGEERARAFKLDGGRWVATLDLEPDPGSASFLKGGRIERRVR